MRKFCLVCVMTAIFGVTTGVSWAERSAGPADAVNASSAASSIADRNVLIIVIDALRADHLGCYGYSRNTSPYIDAMAAQATLFEQATAVSSFTGESVSALFSGLLPSMSGTGNAEFASPSPETTNLGELFSAAGYVTGFFTTSTALFDPAYSKGFVENDHTNLQFSASGTGQALSNRVLDFLRRQAGRKTLTYVHYYDPHDPYGPPDRLYLRFASAVYPSPITVRPQVLGTMPALVADGFGPGEARFEDMKIRYDAEIADSDESVQTLIEGMRSLGILDNTLVIITADHGEEFLEHGYATHWFRLYRESLHVPMLWWAPGIFPAQRIADRVSSIDFLPTLLALAHIPNTRTDVYGTPLFDDSGGTPVFQPRTKPVISEMLLQTVCVLHAITVGNYKYVAAQRWHDVPGLCTAFQTHHQLLAQYRAGTLPLADPWGPAVHEELFDIQTDPGEQQNILSQHPAELASARAALDAYKTMAQGMPKVTIPVSERPTVPDQNLAYAKLADVSPVSGYTTGGTVVSLTGRNLAGASLAFGGVAATDVSISEDGTRVTATTPPHAAGAVSIVATTALGPSDALAFIYEIQPPTARFAAQPRSGESPLTVDFTDLSVPGASSITAWDWDFGDGSSSTDRNPVHTYMNWGAYTVTLTVTAQDGQTHSWMQVWYVNVDSALPFRYGAVSLAAILLLGMGTCFSGVRQRKPPMNTDRH